MIDASADDSASGSPTSIERTHVAIVGAGPAGLLLGCLLERHGVDSVIVETRSRVCCEARNRAGVLEQGTRELLIEAGVGGRMEREGLVHGGSTYASSERVTTLG